MLQAPYPGATYKMDEECMFACGHGTGIGGGGFVPSSCPACSADGERCADCGGSIQYTAMCPMSDGGEGPHASTGMSSLEISTEIYGGER